MLAGEALDVGEAFDEALRLRGQIAQLAEQGFRAGVVDGATLAGEIDGQQVGVAPPQPLFQRQ